MYFLIADELIIFDRVAQTITVLVDESPNGVQRLWIDGNGNGDFTDDPTVQRA